jgi:primosomal protein N' (replication factor Y)
MLGFGIERVMEEINKNFPDINIFKMDGETIKTVKQGKETKENFLSTSGSILIGTEMIFSYFNGFSEPIERIAVVSLDSLFALPDFKINEKIFHILLELRSMAKKVFLIQSRLIESTTIFDNILRGNLSGFYKEEIENRKNFDYPPFKTLIKITKTGKENIKVKRDIDKLAKELDQWKPTVYPAFTPKIKNIYSWHILLKLEPGSWPEREKELYQKLSLLQSVFKIDIEPESLL